MNERIKELMAEASHEVRSHGAFGESERYTELDPEKFAELIVQECIETLGTFEDYWTHEQQMSELKKHFGVE